VNGKTGDKCNCEAVVPSRNSVCNGVELSRDMEHTQLDLVMEENIDRGLQNIIVGRESLERVENVD
jgi:hypothetical protein